MQEDQPWEAIIELPSWVNRMEQAEAMGVENRCK